MQTTMTRNYPHFSQMDLSARQIEQGKITLNDWLPLYLEHLKSNITVNTFNNYNSYIQKHLLPDLGSYPLCELTAPLIKNFIFHKIKYGRIRIRGTNHGLSEKTVKEYFVLLKKALDKAVEDGILSFNPCHCISFPKQTKQEVQIMEQEEQEKLEEHICDAYMANSSLFVKVALYTGMRNGEICALKIKDIDLKKDVIHVAHTLYRSKTMDGKTSILLSQTKNKRERYVPIPKELKRSLMYYFATMPEEIKNSPEQFLFVNQRGRPLEPRRLLYHFHRLLKDAGMIPTRFHNLRHTFATRCLECGIEMKIVSKILGHSSIQITADLYTHVTHRAMLKEMAKFKKENWNGTQPT